MGIAGGAGTSLRIQDRVQVLGWDVGEEGIGAEALVLKVQDRVADEVADEVILAGTGTGTGTIDVCRRRGGTPRPDGREDGAEGAPRGLGVRRGGVAGMIEPCQPAVLMRSPFSVCFLLRRCSNLACPFFSSVASPVSSICESPWSLVELSADLRAG